MFTLFQDTNDNEYAFIDFETGSWSGWGTLQGVTAQIGTIVLLSTTYSNTSYVQQNSDILLVATYPIEDYQEYYL